jgi:hypothetical protein
MKLFLCTTCHRHIKHCEAACPFCGGIVSSAACADTAVTAPRMSRAALLGTAGATLLVVACGGSAYGGIPFCPSAVEFSSPCGFSSVTTTCSGVAPNCFANGAGSQCSLSPIAESCMVSLVLGDGTKHEFSITVAPSETKGCGNVVTSPMGNQDFTSPTCPSLAFPDSGADASTDALLDAQDATTDDGG